MLARTFHALGHGFPWPAPADPWCMDTARTMLAEGYCPSAILAKLTAYGAGFYAAQECIRTAKAERA